MHFNKLKRYGAILLAGILAVSLIGCKKENNETTTSKEETSGKEETTTEENPDYVKSTVTLPDDFGNMIYPLEALMTESYSKGLPYFGEDSEEDQADSFWFSMAVLTSLMNNYVKDVAVDTDTRFIYLDDATVDMYASVLYNAYAQGSIEFPELDDNNTYAVYDEENESYGFVMGDVGDLTAVITDCEDQGDGYLLTAELQNSKTSEVCGTYEIGIVGSSYEGEDNAFAYSVDTFRVVEEREDSSLEENTEEQEEATDTSEDTEEENNGAEEETSDRGNFSVDIGEDISQEDALNLAQDYYGEDAEYSYKGKVTVGDYEYYDFTVKGDSISATDVLVSVDGQDVLGGTENEDGSWSFDQ